jgi:hypothetical protein
LREWGAKNQRKRWNFRGKKPKEEKPLEAKKDKEMLTL